MRGWRIGLIVLGAGLMALGGLFLVQRLAWWQLGWLVVWLAACVVVHDGILVPILSGARAAWRRGSGGLPRAAVWVVEGGFLVAGGLALIVVPEVWAQGRHPANPTILAGDYAGRLVIAWVVVALAVLVVVRILVRRGGRAGETPQRD